MEIPWISGAGPPEGMPTIFVQPLTYLQASQDLETAHGARTVLHSAPALKGLCILRGIAQFNIGVQYSEAILPRTVASNEADKASQNRNLLLITYSFPPFGGVGVHRALSLARYLPENGWNVHVLTARNPSAVGSDAELLRLIPEQVAVHRIPTLDLPFAIKKTIKRLIGGGHSAPQPAAIPETQPASPSLKKRLKQTFMELLTPDPQVLWLPFAIPAAAWIVRRYEIGTVIVTVPHIQACESAFV